jgi:PilZ domain
VSTRWEYIGDTQCEQCGGTGKKPEGESCPICWGTGLLPVFKQHTVSTPPVQPSERRRFPRYYTDLPIRLRNQQEEELAGRCIVISEAGVAAVLPKPISTGSVVTLELPIPTLHPAVLKTLVLVRNQVTLRHGCEFLALKDSEREAIRQFCGGLVTQS